MLKISSLKGRKIVNYILIKNDISLFYLYEYVSDMVRIYAKFSKEYSIIHYAIVTLLVLLIGISAFQLLEEEKLWFSLGLLIPIPFFVFFAKASSYRKKYLHS